MCDAAKFVFVGGGSHGEEAGGTVQQVGLNYIFEVCGDGWGLVQSLIE